MNLLLVGGIFNLAAIVTVLVLMFVLYRQGWGVALYPMSLIGGGIIWAIGRAILLVAGA